MAIRRKTQAKKRSQPAMRQAKKSISHTGTASVKTSKQPSEARQFSFSRQHVATREFVLPLRKIMREESSVTYCRINPAIQLYQALVFFIAFAIFLAIAIFAGSLASGLRMPSTLVVAGLIFLSLPFFVSWGIEIAYLPETFRFSLQQRRLFVRHGAIVPSIDIVPYENVQDAQVIQGIVERIFGMASVLVSTPAGTVYLLGIPLDAAQDFRKDLMSLAKMHRGLAE